MSTGTPLEYEGISGVADSGGDSLHDDLNLIYSVRTPESLDALPLGPYR